MVTSIGLRFAYCVRLTAQSSGFRSGFLLRHEEYAWVAGSVDMLTSGNHELFETFIGLNLPSGVSRLRQPFHLQNAQNFGM
jgi:hypothetical protein